MKDKHTMGKAVPEGLTRAKRQVSDASGGKSVSEESQRAGNCVRNLMLHGLAQTPLRPQQVRRRNSYTPYMRVQQVPLDTTYQPRSNRV
jgi:hypothetical protein